MLGERGGGVYSPETTLPGTNLVGAMCPPQLLNRLVGRPREFHRDVHSDQKSHRQGTGGGRYAPVTSQQNVKRRER